MSSILSLLRFINSCLSGLFSVIAMFIVAIMVTALSASAITRFISGTGYDWLIELPPTLVPWLVFPLLGPILRAKGHIQVDIMPTFLPYRPNLYLGLFAYTVTFVGAIIFALAGEEAVALFRQLGQTMELEIELPIWWMYLAFPVGFGVLALFSIEMILETLQKLSSKEQLDNEGLVS